MLLPNKRQRHKSKVQVGENPVFGEKIYFNKILPGELCSIVVSEFKFESITLLSEEVNMFIGSDLNPLFKKCSGLDIFNNIFCNANAIL